MSGDNYQEAGVIPTVNIVADNIPQAHFRATKAVFEQGKDIRTQYDRRDGDQFIDPPSKDARALILVKNPFNQPRYPVISYCEIGTYIAEVMGVKDHLVVPFDELVDGLEKGGEISTLWPYTYSQRLRAYPLGDSKAINQLGTLVERVSASPITRRAVAMTGVPPVDNLLKEDMPCLREIHLRAIEDDGEMYLHMSTTWRSRDLFKAWPDNTLALTFLQARFADKISEKMGRKVKVGSYSDYSTSPHLYGQDIKEKGVKAYVDRGEEVNLKKAMSSDFAAENLVVPQLEDLLGQEQRVQWNFPPEAIEMIEGMIRDIGSGKIVA